MSPGYRHALSFPAMPCPSPGPPPGAVNSCSLGHCSHPIRPDQMNLAVQHAIHASATIECLHSHRGPIARQVTLDPAE